MNKIKKIGIELEGYWNNTPENFMYDGSVSELSKYRVNGEAVSPPCEALQELNSFINKNYPDYVSEKCGMHIHISVEKSNYVKLLEYEYQQELYRFLRDDLILKNSTSCADRNLLKNRLRGENNFCKNYYDSREFYKISNEQIIKTDKATCRYRMLNFCYSMHGTIELRVLPMFQNKETAVDVVRQYVGFIENYLRKEKKVVYKMSYKIKESAGVLCV